MKSKTVKAVLTWAAVLCLPTLKLTGAINWAWWIVLAPVWATLAICFLIAVAITVMALNGEINEIED